MQCLLNQSLPMGLGVAKIIHLYIQGPILPGRFLLRKGYDVPVAGHRCSGKMSETHPTVVDRYDSCMIPALYDPSICLALRIIVT